MTAQHCLITCEHGGNRVPAAYRPLFAGQAELLASHRGWDPGALVVARDLAGALAAPLCYATVSRLVVDLNRSPDHPRLHGGIIRAASPALRREIMARHYLPYRERVECLVAGALAAGGRVVHVSSHSFTPVLGGEVRQADIGLLYDPARSGEATLARRWQTALQSAGAGLRVRRNYPYRGTSDGFTAYLRRRFPDPAYIGIELEVNQRLVAPGHAGWRRLRRLLVETLREALAQ